MFMSPTLFELVRADNWNPDPPKERANNDRERCISDPPYTVDLSKIIQDSAYALNTSAGSAPRVC
jgi:hypothetical protein